METPQSKKEQRKAQKELKKAGRKDALSHEAGGQEGPKAVHRMEVSKQNGKQAGLAKGDQKPAKPSPKQPASPKKGAVISNAQARDPTLARKAEGRIHIVAKCSAHLEVPQEYSEKSFVRQDMSIRAPQISLSPL